MKIQTIIAAILEAVNPPGVAAMAAVALFPDGFAPSHVPVFDITRVGILGSGPPPNDPD